MKVKVRLKMEEEAKGITREPRRVFIGEILPIPKEFPLSLQEDFIRLKGKHLLLERHQTNIEALEDPVLQEYLIPVQRVDWITVLPDDLDISRCKYQVVGGRLICGVTGKTVSLKETGET
ncbi:hypothetical protein J7K43_04175 [Candidatus Calescamantes bacterium]|nr:hypothetical protein [Candidatus Calescamantes bacterium]